MSYHYFAFDPIADSANHAYILPMQEEEEKYPRLNQFFLYAVVKFGFSSQTRACAGAMVLLYPQYALARWRRHANLPKEKASTAFSPSGFTSITC
jgi:hypothetical protein